MANVLTKFLVGIGWETSEFQKGSRDIQRSMGDVKTQALGTSAALIGAFGGLAASVTATSNRVDQFALKTSKFNTSTDFVYKFGNALRLLGGDADEAFSAVSGVEEILTNLRLSGDIGPLAELPKAGVDIEGLTQSRTADEFLAKLAEQLPELDKQQQQLVQNALGFSDATMKSLRGGAQEFDRLVYRADELAGGLEGLTENSRALQEQLGELGLRIEGVTNELAEKFLPSLIGVSSWFNKFIEDNRETISDVIDYAAENPGASAALIGSAGAVVGGATLGKLGMTGTGAAISKAGQVGLAVTGATVAADVTNRGLAENVPGYVEASQGFDRFLMGLTGLERIPSPREVFLGAQPDQAPAPVDQSYQVPESPPMQTPVDQSYQVPEQTRLPLPDQPAYGPQIIDQTEYTPVEMEQEMYKDVTVKEDSRAAAERDNLVKAMQAAKINVANDVNLTVKLDGQALDSKITEVTERNAFDTVNDMTTTTAR